MVAAPEAESARTPLLSVRNLSVEYATAEGTVHAVTDVSFDIFPRETLGLVGESGSGKTATCLAILGLLRAPGGRVAGGEVLFKGRRSDPHRRRDFRRLRGRDISMILQESISALNPVMTIGDQISEAIRVHNQLVLAVEATPGSLSSFLDLVGFPEPHVRYRRYPHELSGGMRQRAMIAIAIANRPSLLIADEPTTALDVTIQAQIVDVLKRAQEESDAATLLVTHDLGLVSQIADRIVVMYAGRVVETGEIHASFSSPRHPYTIGLLESVPRLIGRSGMADSDPRAATKSSRPSYGLPVPPSLLSLEGRARCRDEMPALRKIAAGPMAACHFAEELDGRRTAE